MSVTHDNKVKSCIDVQNVSFSYDGNSVLEDITFQIQSGDYVGIIGPNGGGKTTLLNLLLGLLQPTAGSIHIFGHSVDTAHEHIEVGYVPQRIAQLAPSFPATVEEIVLSGRTMRRGFFAPLSEADRSAVIRALDVTGMSKAAKKRVGALSGGERQRVWIARALASEPRILILDEPTVGVDVSTMESLYSLLTKLHQELGLTILLVSHDIDTVAREVTTVLCLNRRLCCHVPAKEFNKEDYLRDIYGAHVKHIHHEHQ